MNRRMRTRMSGGVRGGMVTPPSYSIQFLTQELAWVVGARMTLL